MKSAFTDHLAQPLDPRVKLAGAILDDAGAQAGVFIVLQTKSIETRGITDQDNKDGPELLSSINPTFTWVRLAQRVPVRIRLTDVPDGVLISAGMTCTVIMEEGATPQFGLGLRKSGPQSLGRLGMSESGRSSMSCGRGYKPRPLQISR